MKNINGPMITCKLNKFENELTLILNKLIFMVK